LRGMSERHSKLVGGLGRDRENAGILAPFESRLHERQSLHARRGIVDCEQVLFRWMLEEFRVSLTSLGATTARQDLTVSRFGLEEPCHQLSPDSRPESARSAALRRQTTATQRRPLIA
jgi:hypothetical protein